MTPLRLTSFTAVSAMGRGLAETLDALQQQRSGLAPCSFETVDIETHVGEVPGVDATVLPEALRGFNCRNNRLAQLGLMQDDFMAAVASSAKLIGVRGASASSSGRAPRGCWRRSLRIARAIPRPAHCPGNTITPPPIIPSRSPISSCRRCTSKARRP
jgi:hypothetical protein